MKFIFLSFLISLPAWSLCNKPVNKSKVVLFVDTNNSRMEIERAEKAACSRGERLAIVPKNYLQYEKYVQKIEAIREKQDNCVFLKKPNCESFDAPKLLAVKELTKFRNTQPTIHKALEAELKALSAQKVKVQNVTISGHDGGGQYSGYKGKFSREELMKMFDEHKDLNEVKSILLLGCYSSVQKEVMNWRNIFPDIKLIAGYDGKAPLASRPAGHDFVEDILKNEKAMVSESNSEKVDGDMKALIRHMENLNVAIYLRPVCEKADDPGANGYYYSSKGNRKFEKYDISKCIEYKDRIVQISRELELYFSGKREPEAESQDNSIFKMYDEIREKEHCLEIVGIDINPNILFFLRFYKEVKQNFSNFYAKDLKLASSVMDNLNTKELEAAIKKELDQMAMDIQQGEAELLEEQKDPSKAVTSSEKLYQETLKERDDLLKQPAYQKLVKTFPELKPYEEFPDGVEYQEDASEEYQKLRSLNDDVFMRKTEAQQIKDDPAAYIEEQKTALASKKQTKNNHQLLLDTIGAGKLSQLVWVPTQKNLETKSRKELLDNINNIDTFLSLPGIPPKQQATMEWIRGRLTAHFQYFINPFTWHEYTGETEAPLAVIPLEL